jgi:hypothetical protein
MGCLDVQSNALWGYEPFGARVDDPQRPPRSKLLRLAEPRSEGE